MDNLREFLVTSGALPVTGKQWGCSPLTRGGSTVEGNAMDGETEKETLWKHKRGTIVETETRKHCGNEETLWRHDGQWYVETY